MLLLRIFKNKEEEFIFILKFLEYDVILRFFNIFGTCFVMLAHGLA